MAARSILTSLVGRNRVPKLEIMSARGILTARPRLILRPLSSIEAISRMTCGKVARAGTIAPPTGDLKIDGNQTLKGARIIQGSTVNLFFSILGERLAELDIELRVFTLTRESVLTKTLSGRAFVIDSTSDQPQGKTLISGTGNLFAYDTRRLEKEIELSYEFWAINSVITREHLIESGTFTLSQP